MEKSKHPMIVGMTLMRSKSGMSLIELMIAVAIVSVLVSTGSMSYSEMVDRSRARSVDSRVAGLSQTILALKELNNGNFPHTRRSNGTYVLIGSPWLGRYGQRWVSTEGSCNLISDPQDADNQEALRTLCQEMQVPIPGPVSQNTYCFTFDGGIGMGYLYIANPSNYKVMGHCAGRPELSRFIDPLRDGGVFDNLPEPQFATGWGQSIYTPGAAAW